MLISVSFVNASDIDNNQTDDIGQLSDKLSPVDDFSQLSDQINSTNDGETLNLKQDYQSTNASSQIIISKSITIDGENHTISAPDVSRVFIVAANNVCIKNLNFVNCNKADLAGGVISWFGNNGSLVNCNFLNNSAKSGGGAIVWQGSNALIENCSFIKNSVNYGPAVSLTSGESFDPSVIHIQVVQAHGGALYFNGNNLLVNNCNFTDNYAALAGGAVSISWGNNVKINNSRFKNNRASYAGAIDLNADNFTLTNSLLADNSPVDLFINCPNAVIIDTKLSNLTSWYDYKFLNSFDELFRLINETPEGGVLVLERDYQYIDGSNKGILISKSITIDGAGHTLDGNHLSRMFNITADNVVIKNLNFVNGNAFGRYFSNDVGGGAIYWNGANGFIEGCNFTNNTGYGLEDDPFEKEETIIDDNGTIIHIYRARPMGAKVNEGGAIVWNGTNGTVSKCKFINNHVGYPDSGGAICWRGHFGKIISSEFYENSAWCGAAICWIGHNGTVTFSKIIRNGFFDGGIYWFGKNGTVSYSVLLGDSYPRVLRSYDVSVNADYNFWGDIFGNPVQMTKPDNVKTWYVMNITHNGDLITKGSSVLIEYNLNLLNENATLKPCLCPIDYSGQINYTAPKTGYLEIALEKGEVKVSIDSNDSITSKDLNAYYDSQITYKVKVYDILGKVTSGKVKFKVNKKTYKVDIKNGVATLKLKLKPGKYTIYSSFNDVKVKNTITVKNTLITKDLTKKVKKAAYFKVKVLDSKGKAFKKQSIKIKFKGKTYNVKTNSKGIASFKVPKNLKVGKHTIKTVYKGLTNTNKIIVKK